MVLETFRLANDFTWDRANGIVFDDVIVNQGDANGRKMRVQVVNRGAVENLTGAGLNLAWKASNGKGLDKFTAINAAQGIFEISFTKGMLANVGRINASLQLILPSGGGIVESRPFVISNQASVVDQDSAQSTDSWTALETTLANAEDLEANYTPKLFSLEQQLQQTEQELAAQLAQKETEITNLESNKMDKDTTDISVTQINKNRGKFDQTYMTDEFIQQIAGTTPVNAIPADGSITSKKLAYKAMVGTRSINLFDRTLATNGFYPKYDTGVLIANADYAVSDWILISPNTVYTMTNPNMSAFYDADKVFISGLTGAQATTFTSPATALYIRISCTIAELSTQQLQKGNKILPYVNGTPFLDIDNTVDIPKMKSKVLDFMDVASKNLFDKTKVTDGKYVAYGSGSLGDLSHYSASDYISIEASTVYTINLKYQLAFYDSNKVYISGIASPTTFTTPSTAVFVRLSVPTAELDLMQLELGSEKTSYTTHEKKINTRALDMDTIIKNVNIVPTEIIVAPSGGDFTTISDALASISDASKLKPYRIIVKAGTYNETFTTKDYVDIIGENKFRCIVDFTGSDWLTQSTIFATTTSRIENLTVKVFDAKYPIHSDTNNSGYNLVIKNCVLEHKGSSVPGTWHVAPIGIGLFENQHIELIECEFIGDGSSDLSGGYSTGVYFHNNNSNLGNGYRSMRVEKCNMTNVYYAFRVHGISPVNDQANDVWLYDNLSNANEFIKHDYTTDTSFKIKSRNNSHNGVYVANT